MSSAIRFETLPWPDGGLVQVMPAIDGRLLIDIIDGHDENSRQERSPSHSGLIPAIFGFGPLTDHYLCRGSWNRDGMVPVMGCTCGEWGCDPYYVQIVVTSDEVEWSFEETAPVGPFRFARSDYETALADLELRLPSAAPIG